MAVEAAQWASGTSNKVGRKGLQRHSSSEAEPVVIN